MRDNKYTFRFFSIVEWKDEEKYLNEMHSKGWKFVHITIPGIYHFVKCEPGNVSYQLDYNCDATREKAEYIRLFDDCGWEYIQDCMGYSYFRKNESDNNRTEEIFCDDISRLDMIRRVYKGRIIPLIVIFFLAIVPQLILQYNLGTSFSHGLFITYVVLMLIYIYIFIRFAVCYFGLKNSANRIK